MTRFTAEATWESSLLRHLLAFALRLWDDSGIGRLVAALGRLWTHVFEGSFFGRVWYSTWPSARQAQESYTGWLLTGFGSVVQQFGRRVGPHIKGLWETSLLAGLYRRFARSLMPCLRTSHLFLAYTGYAEDVAASPTEAGRRSTSPVVYLLGAVLGLLPLIPTDFALFGIPVPSPTTLLTIGIWGVAVVWVVRKFMLGDYGWRASPAFLPLAIFLLVAVAATVQSVARGASVQSLVLWLTAGLLFWLIVNVVRNSRDAAVFLGPIMVGASLMAVWGVYQYFFPPVIEERWTDPATSGELTRVFASLGNPNYLAEYMVLFVPLVLALWYQQPKRRLELTVPLVLMTVALLLTYTRGGYLALLIALVILVFMRARRWSVFLFLAALAVPVLAPQSIINRFISAFNVADTSNQYRVNLWIGVLEMIKKFWFVGVGLGAQAFNAVYQDFMLSEARAAHAHNLYLQVLGEVGVVGLFAILWAIFAVVRRTVVVGGNSRNAVLIAAVPAALVGLMFHGLVEHIWYNPKLLFAFWAVAGLGMGLALGDRGDASA